ncbi:hypothetical protein P3342_004917 [Pyrenophora teres f. teres]|nr:hypothetical protein P3342_004917 [Pyrenophora teres f. teres]
MKSAMASEVFPIHLVHDAISYYNFVIAPDLSPCGAPFEDITVQAWASFEEISKHLIVCIVSLHKVVKCLGNEDENQALLLKHQARAAHKLRHMIMDAAHPQLDSHMSAAACMFLCLGIQQSAYGTWRTHLQGAKALIGPWREDMLGHDDFGRFVISVVDIYGATTAPSTLLSKNTLHEHILYLKLVGCLQVEILDTLTPVPLELLKATIAINIHRTAVANQDGPSCLQHYPEIPSRSAILDSLQHFNPYQWAYGLPSKYVLDAESWTLLATCYQAASILYLFQSHSSTADGIGRDELPNHTRTPIYDILLNSIMELFDRRLQGGIHYKFILWPMVICGIEAAARRGRTDLEFLCSSLETTTLELGTLGMREAAEFLKNVWTDCELRWSHSNCLAIDWDDTFKRAPVFLM